MKNAFAPIAAAALLATSGLGFSAPASAETETLTANSFAVSFHYDKAELTTEAGQRGLLQRMETRIRAECVPITRQTPQERDVRRCVDAAMKSALAKFQSDSLASLYTARTAG